MAIFNINARQLDNKAIYVQYQQDGKAKDAAFPSWPDFVLWLQKQISSNSKQDNDKDDSSGLGDMDLDPRPSCVKVVF